MNNRDRFYSFIGILACAAAFIVAYNADDAIRAIDAVLGLGCNCPFPADPMPPRVLRPAQPYVDHYQTYELIDAHNLQRAKHSLPPLTANTRLVVAARKHADRMAGVKKMAHSGIGDGDVGNRIHVEGYGYSWAGENVAAGYADIPYVMSGWMRSPGHRANIMGQQYTEMGAAVAYDKAGQPYWCAVFATPARASRVGSVINP